MAREFAGIDTRSEILRIIKQVVAGGKPASQPGPMAASHTRRIARQ
jgi:hypothetical protein